VIEKKWLLREDLNL